MGEVIELSIVKEKEKEQLEKALEVLKPTISAIRSLRCDDYDLLQKKREYASTFDIGSIIEILRKAQDDKTDFKKNPAHYMALLERLGIITGKFLY